MTDGREIVLDGGKYTVVWKENCGKVEFYAVRYGERWRELVGDILIYHMFNTILELQSQLEIERQGE